MTAWRSRLRVAVSVLEILLGLGLVGIGIYDVLEFLQCRPEAEYCAPLTALGVILTLIPGAALVVAGARSIAGRGVNFLRLQLVMLGVLVAYYVSIYVLFYQLA